MNTKSKKKDRKSELLAKFTEIEKQCEDNAKEYATEFFTEFGTKQFSWLKDYVFDINIDYWQELQKLVSEALLQDLLSRCAMQIKPYLKILKKDELPIVTKIVYEPKKDNAKYLVQNGEVIKYYSNEEKPKTKKKEKPKNKQLSLFNQSNNQTL